MALSQSLGAVQVFPSAHFGALAPPQSTSVSSRFLVPSVWDAVPPLDVAPLLEPLPLDDPDVLPDDEPSPPSPVASSEEHATAMTPVMTAMDANPSFFDMPFEDCTKPRFDHGAGRAQRPPVAQ
jgi:hypothetical protein